MLGGNNLGVNDPRRMGKTVWLDLFCAQPGDGFEAVKIDFEGVQSAEEFLIRAVDRPAQAPQPATPARCQSSRRCSTTSRSPADPVTIKTGVSTRSPTDLLGETIRSIDAHLGDEVLLVIAMDEVPIAIS